MLFNSIDFAIFLPIVFILYWFVTQKSFKHQNLLIVFASYVFYGWWDWKFLTLIIFSTITDFFIGMRLNHATNKRNRKSLLLISILVNLGFLGFFKYYNFFVENFVDAFRFFGAKINTNTLNVILPVGISFYTFQTLSYSIDVYKRKITHTKDFIAFAAFVSFFPQLVAGPIERATNLLPQFLRNRSFDYQKSTDGLKQILWGLFKKIVIADNAAEIANHIFNNSSSYSGSTLLLGAFFFAFQIYGDFSGYSDIAIGTSRLFGFNLRINFAFPYFSRDIAEFWRRWHISLSSWFRDYLYIPLGGSKGGRWMRIRNTFIIFLVSGFWHGANWTFLFWGFLNALYFLPLLLLNRNRINKDIISIDRFLPTFRQFINISITFTLTTLAWIFFRAENIQHAFNYISTIFSKSLFTLPNFIGMKHALSTLFLILFLCFIEWIERDQDHPLAKLGGNWKRNYRWLFYYSVVFIIIYFSGEEQEFIYFQF